MNFKFPPIAHSYGVIKYPCQIPFNRIALCKMIAWWEKETKIKFTGKLFYTKNPGCWHRNVGMDCCDIRTLFHEL